MDNKKRKTTDLNAGDAKVMKITAPFSNNNVSEKFYTLVDLIEENNIKDSLEMIDEEKLYTVVDSEGATLTHYAAKYGNIDFIQYAIAKKWDMDVKNQDSKTPLMLAADNCQEEVIDILFKAEMNENDSIISKKCFYDLFIDDEPSLDTVYKFLDELKLKMKSSSNQELAERLHLIGCPIAYIIRWKNKNVVKKMLQLGCFVDAKMCDKKLTGMHIAAIEGDLEMIRLLDQYNADITAESCEKRTPLGYYLTSKNRISKKSPNVLRILARKTELFFRTDAYGLYPINLAMSLGDKLLIKSVLKLNIDWSRVEHQNECFLYRAAGNPYCKVFDVLKEFKQLRKIYKKCVNLKNDEGSTPLHYACSTANPDAVEFFIQQEADLSIVNKFNETALELAKKRKGFAEKSKEPRNMLRVKNFEKCMQLLELAIHSSNIVN